MNIRRHKQSPDILIQIIYESSWHVFDTCPWNMNFNQINEVPKNFRKMISILFDASLTDWDSPSVLRYLFDILSFKSYLSRHMYLILVNEIWISINKSMKYQIIWEKWFLSYLILHWLIEIHLQSCVLHIIKKNKKKIFS